MVSGEDPTAATGTDGLVAVEDGKPGCPAKVWYDGVYGPHRCGFGKLGECHQHGKFQVIRAGEWNPPPSD